MSERSRCATALVFLGLVFVFLFGTSDVLAQTATVDVRVLQAGVQHVPLWQRLVSLLGLVVMPVFAWLLSTNRKRIPWRILAWGTGLQLVFGLIVLKTAAGKAAFDLMNDAVLRLLKFTEEGSRFLFGKYMDLEFSMALRVLPTIVFFSSLMTVAYHLGIMQRIVYGMAWLMQKTMRTSGAETLSTAANIFVGQTEAPLLVKPYIGEMTRSELMTVMVGGFATVAGGVLAAYVGMLQSRFPDIAGHLIAASVMSAPATLVIAKLMLPEDEAPKTGGTLGFSTDRPDINVIDAAARGASEGLILALNVGAMLVAFIALVALVNYVFALPALWHNQSVWADAVRSLKTAGKEIPVSCDGSLSADALARCIRQAVTSGLPAAQFSAWTPWTLERILGFLFWPFAWVMGVPAVDCSFVARILGEKLVLNEFVAYLHLSDALGAGAKLSHRSVVIATYALCGFANFGSIGIQIAGIGSLAPSRRSDLAVLGLRAMVGGTLASFMTAAVAGLMV